MILEKYSDLPTHCPECKKKFAESNFHIRFKPRFQVSTFIMLVVVAIPACILCVMFLPGLVGFLAAAAALSWLLAVARKRPQVVRMNCVYCRWKHPYLLRS